MILAFHKAVPPIKVDNQLMSIDLLKMPCDNTEVYCETDGDCGKCNSASHCKSGRCLPRANATNCEITKGFAKYLIGNPEFGEWRVQCISTDPGIAKKDGNLMCNHGALNVDYTIKMPVIADCQCKPVYVPATSNIREYAVCNDKLVDLVNLAYGISM